MTDLRQPAASMALPEAEYKSKGLHFLKYDRGLVGLSVAQRGKPTEKGKHSHGNSLEKGVRHDHQENL